MATPLLQHYRHLLDARESVSDKTGIVLILNLNGQFLKWNRAAEALTGYSPKEMVGSFLWDKLLFEEDREPVRRQFKWIKSGWPPGSVEYRWKLHDGTVRWMANSNFEQCISPTGVECLAFNTTDVTESRLTHNWRTPLFAQFVRAREIEHHEISRFIHDTVAQDLAALTFSLELSQRDRSSEDAVHAMDITERCCRDIRLLGYLLEPPALRDAGFIETMNWHVMALRETAELDIDFTCEVARDILSRDAGSLLFSVVHELTAKSILSRSRKPLTIVLKREGQSIVLEMRGVFGLHSPGDRDYPSIRERVGALGGRCEMMPFCARIAFPLMQ